MADTQTPQDAATLRRAMATDALMPPEESFYGGFTSALGPLKPQGMSALVGAGASFQGVIDQLTRAVRFVQHARSIGTIDEAKYKSLLDELNTDILERATLYKPLRQAHPYMTGIGEAAPAIASGPTSAGMMAYGNVSRAYLNELMERFHKEYPDAIPGWLKKAADTINKVAGGPTP